MKTILLILALALVARAQISGYQALDIAEAQSSTEIQTLIQFGLQTIVQDAIQLGYFNNTNFELLKINSVYEQVADNGDYLFDVVYADPSGVTISANFEANYDVALNSISIVSYSYGVSYPAVDPSDDSDDTPVVENWSKLSVSSFNSNQELQNLFQFGFAKVIANGINNASIPNTTFVTAVISSLAQRSTDNGVVYRFTCKATDQQGTTLDLTFDVLNQLYSSVYGVTLSPLPPVDNSTNSTNPDSGSEEGEGEDSGSEEGENDNSGSEDGEGENSEDGEETIPVEETTPVEEEPTVPIDPVEPGNNSTNTTEPTTPVDPVEPGNNSTNTTEPEDEVDVVSGLTYTRLDVDEALQSNLVNTLLKYGYEGVTKLGINQNKLQNTTYSLLDVNKVGRYNFSNGVSYLFEVNLIGDNRRILVDTNYTVYYRYSNKTAKLTAYFYNYTNYRNEIPVPEVPEVPETNTTIPEVPEVPETNTTIPEVPETNTTIPEVPEVPETNTTVPEVPETNTTTPVDLYAQIQQDALLNSLFSFGVDRVLASGISKGKLVDTDYNVTDVFNYKRTNLSSTANFNFETKLANANGSITIYTNFTVNYRYSNQSMRLNGFSYNSTITKVVPNTPNNTNTTTPTPNNSTNTTVPDATNTTTNGTSNSTSNNYVAVNASEIASSQEIQSVLSYGTQQIIQRGLQAGKVPSDNYTISEVVSVSRLAQKGGNSYQASVNLDGDNEVEVRTTFTAFFNSTSQAVSLQKYSYVVRNIPVA